MFSLIRTLLVTAAVQQGAADAKRRLRRALLQLMLCVAGSVIALAGAIFLLIALHDSLAYRFDPLTAKLICGGGLVLVGFIVFLIAQQLSVPRRIYSDRPMSAASVDVAAALG